MELHGMDNDPERVAAHLTDNERAALLSLPARDRGDMHDDLWWAYHSILDQGLATSAGNFMIVATALGEAVIGLLRRS